jgi:hypothetical protein
MDSVSIDNGLFVGGLSKKSKLATANMVSLIKRSSKRSQFSWSMTALAKLSEESPVPAKLAAPLAKLLMATSEAVPLVKVKTTVRVLPSITARLLRVTPSARLVE